MASEVRTRTCGITIRRPSELGYGHREDLVREAGLEPAIACSQGRRVAASLLPDVESHGRDGGDGRMEPTAGIEPATRSLQNSRSTV